MHIERRVADLICRVTVLAALLCGTSAQNPGPGWNIQLAFGAPAFTFAKVCDPGAPLVFVALAATNNGDVDFSFTIGATDASGVLTGDLAVATLAPGDSTNVTVPLMRRAGVPVASLAGQHVVTVAVRAPGATRISQTLTVPATLCGAASATGSLQRAGTIDQKGRYAGIAVLPVAPPTALRTVASGPDCGSHVGPLGALVCPDMMKSGDMLLIWDWSAGNGFTPVDGYRVYTGNGMNVNSGDFVGKLVATRPGTGVTLFDVPKPSDGKGYGGHCYAITAYAGARESKPSAPFCAGGGEVAQKATFAPVRQASIMRQSYNRDELAPQNNLRALGYAVVGYQYMAFKHITGDSENAQISRYAMQFDVTRIAGRKVFEAHVTMDILSNSLSRLDCTTSVALGTSDWWTESWPDAAFFATPSMTVKNNQLTIDLTNPVTSWANGRSNQGIILRDDDENLRAFQNASCQTYYRNPVLTVTYY